MFFIVAFLGVNCNHLAVQAPRLGVMAPKGVMCEQDGLISKMEEEYDVLLLPWFVHNSTEKKHKVKRGRVSKYGTRWLTELS